MAGISGLPGMAWNGDGEFGTRNGVHVVVYVSSSSPPAQDAYACGVRPGRNVRTAAPAAATVKPQVRRRNEITPSSLGLLGVSCMTSVRLLGSADRAVHGRTAAHTRLRRRLGALGLAFLGQTDALACVPAGAWDGATSAGEVDGR